MSTIKSSSEHLTLNADGANNDIIFQSNGSNVATLDQDGTLTVGDVTAETTTGAELILSRDDTSIAIDDLIGGIQFKSNDSSSSPDPQICGIKAISTGATNANPKLCLYGGESNYNANTPQVIIDSSDSVTVGTGDLIFGTAGKGIVLGATSNVDANTLDDYEEGTWTPNQGAGLTVVGTFSSSGKYTKIGRLVHIEGKVGGTTSVAMPTTDRDISTNNPFTPTGSLRASGLAIDQLIGASAGLSVIPGTGRLIIAETIAATTTINFSATYSI